MNCIKNLCKGLSDLAMKIINYEEKKMIPLTNEKNESDEKQKVCHICKKKKIVQTKTIKMHLNYTIKSEIIVITRGGAAHNICNLR